MANLVTFDAYLRYVRWQAAPAEACAVRAWLAQPVHATQAQAWMQHYVHLLAQEPSQASPMPDFEAMQDKLFATLELRPVAAFRQSRDQPLVRAVRRFTFQVQTQVFPGLWAAFHRLHWQ